MTREKQPKLVRAAPADGLPAASAPSSEPETEGVGRAAGPEGLPSAPPEATTTPVTRLQAFARRARSPLGALAVGFGYARRWGGKLLPSSLESVETGLATLRNILVNFAVFLLALAMLVLTWREMTSKAIRIDTIHVEDATLLQDGLTSRVVAVKLLEQMNEIEQTAWTSMERSDIAVGEEEKLPDIEIPGTGLQFADFVAFARAFAGGGAPRITGEALAVGEQQNELQITILTSGRQPMTARKNLEEVDALLREAAEHVYRNNRRVLYAFYLDARSREEPQRSDTLTQQALEVIEEAVAGELSNEERSRIYNLWGVILTDRQKFEKALEKFDLALEKTWTEWLLGSDRGWYAELMKARALSHANRHREAVDGIEAFIEDHPDKAEKGQKARDTAYHNWGVWSVERCRRGGSADCEPPPKYGQELSRAHRRIGDVAYLQDDDLETALRHARRAVRFAAGEVTHEKACDLLLDVLEDLPEASDARADARDARQRCESPPAELGSL